VAQQETHEDSSSHTVGEGSSPGGQGAAPHSTPFLPPNALLGAFLSGAAPDTAMMAPTLAALGPSLGDVQALLAQCAAAGITLQALMMPQLMTPHPLNMSSATPLSPTMTTPHTTTVPHSAIPLSAQAEQVVYVQRSRTKGPSHRTGN